MPTSVKKRSTSLPEIDLFDRTEPTPISVISYRRFLREIIWLVDIFIIFVCCIASTVGYHLAAYGAPGNIMQGIVFGLMSGALFVALGASRQLYKAGGVFNFIEQSKIILKAWAFVALMFFGLVFMTKTQDDFSRGSGFIFLASAPLALIISRYIAKRMAIRLTRTGQPLNMRLAVVGSETLCREFIKYGEAGALGLSVVGTFDPDMPIPEPAGAQEGDEVKEAPLPEVTGTEPGGVMRGNLRDLHRLAQKTRVDQLVVALPWSQGDKIERVVDEISNIPVPISLSPDPSAFRFAGHPVSIINGVPFFNIRPRRIDGVQGALKIAMDRVCSTILLLVLSPVMLAVAVAIKATSPGPILFRQRRNGFNHEVFHILKFRTMTTTDDGAVVRQASRNDQRITKVGAFLRKTSLDELPQLMNVLKGDMSLVGPRPHALAHNREYVKVISHYARRHNVKPGITGLAQVSGFRGETNTFEKMDGRIAHDLKYIENWSLWLDIRILLMTVVKVLKQDNAY